MVEENSRSTASPDVLGLPMRCVCAGGGEGGGSMEGATVEPNKQAVEGDRLKLDWNLAPAPHVAVNCSLSLFCVYSRWG